MKPIKYIAALGLLSILASCEQSDLAPQLDVQISLDESNSYLVGQPVRFNFEGQVDNITIWTGDATHEYQYRDRTVREQDMIESATLELQVLGTFGNQYGSLAIGMSDKFTGLSGPADLKKPDSGIADKQKITAFGEIDAWTSLDYQAMDVAANNNKTVTIKRDVSDLASNFSLALRWKSRTITEVQRTYNIAPVVRVTYKDNYPTQILKTADLGFVALSMAPERATDVYDIDRGTGDKGVVSYKSFTTPILMNGSAQWGGESDKVNLAYVVDTWCISKPQSLAVVAPDKGANIKNLSTDLPSYEYTYLHPGSYKVIFVLWSGSYAGASVHKTVEYNITIIKPI